MSRCKELERAFGESFVCGQCSKDRFSVGDTVYYKGTPYEIERILPNYLDCVSYTLKGYKRPYKDYLFSVVAFFQIVGNRVFGLDHKHVCWVEPLDDGGWACLEGCSYSTFNTTEDLKDHVLKSNSSTKDWYVAVFNHNEKPMDNVFDWLSVHKS